MMIVSCMMPTMAALAKVVADVNLFAGTSLHVYDVLARLSTEFTKFMCGRKPSAKFFDDIAVYVVDGDASNLLFTSLIEGDFLEFMEGFFIFINERSLY